MYTPPAFAVDDRDELHDLIEAYNFGILVSVAGGEPTGSHLPFMLERDRGSLGTLYAHLAAANPQCQALNGSVLAIFAGPHGYVSPTHYAAELAVPTWNYIAVHVYARPRLIEDAGEKRALVERLVAFHENGRDPSWRMGNGAEWETFTDKMLAGITGLELTIERLEGKAKLSQNRPIEDRQQVIAALARSTAAGDRALATVMQAKLASG